LQSLTGRLQDADIDFLASVLETMSDANVGTQAFLDMMMALILAQHRQDCQAISSSMACRLSSSLGRLAAIQRLRPRGVGGPSTSTNQRVMDLLQARICEHLDELTPHCLAQLDDYYITRICGDTERRRILTRIAELQVGLIEPIEGCRPQAIRLQESVQRELPDAFRWSLPRHVRDYLSQLKAIGLRESAPWTVGDWHHTRRVPHTKSAHLSFTLR